MSEIASTAYEKARAVLDRACSPLGLMASPEGYPHIWARDSAITALGAGLLPGHQTCLRAALETLAGQQSELGAIPNNVNVATGRPMGYSHQAWSAGMYVFAYRCIEDGRLPVFGATEGW